MKATQRHNDEAMELLRVEAQMLKGFLGEIVVTMLSMIG